MNDELGWGSEAEHSAWGTAGSVALLVTAGLYWSSLWLVSGLAPVPTLASRALRRFVSRRADRTPVTKQTRSWLPDEHR